MLKLQEKLISGYEMACPCPFHCTCIAHEAGRSVIWYIPLLQDLKDHFRAAGDVVYTESYNDGTGIVEYSRYEDFKRALRDMDDSKFRSHEVSCFSFSAVTLC